MKKFLVLYLVPYSIIASWKSTDQETKKIEEAKMKIAWDLWTEEYGTLVKETHITGSTTKVTRQEVSDIKNDVVLFSLVEAVSQEEVAEAFKTHPHLNIPETSIEIMPAGPLPEGV